MSPPNRGGASTFAALLTPPGRGAVATIGVRGPRAVSAVQNAFQAAKGVRLAEAHCGRILFGRFHSVSGSEEELVVCRTAGEEVEIHCHGGRAAIDAILQTLAAAGVQRVEAEAWLIAAGDDLLRREAILALGQATTERTASILLDQLRGALRREIEGIHKDMISAPKATEPIRQEFISTQASRLALLCSRIRLGRRLTTPFRVVLAGQPNVGKSSLINALCGYQRAIVSPQPGTTRDVVTAATAFAGWPVELTDTAGLRVATDELESAGIARTEQQLAQADLVLIVVDHRVGWSTAEEELLQRSRLPLVVYNKCDLSGRMVHRHPGLLVSALTGAGLPEVEELIAARLGLQSFRPGDAVPFTERQARWLEQISNPHRPAEITAEYCLQQFLTNPLPPDW